MIKNITLENFFSFGNQQTIELNAGVNVLVGINGSGKSNFIRALELLYEGVSGKGVEEIFQRKWSGFEGVKNLTPNLDEKIKLSFEFPQIILADSKLEITKSWTKLDYTQYEIEIFPEGKTNYSLKEIITLQSPKSKHTLQYLDSEKQTIIGKTNKNPFQKLIYNAEKLKNTELITRQLFDPDRFNFLFLLQDAIKSISLYANFNTTFNSPIRNLNSYQSETKLRSDGSNLVSLLQKIKNNHTLEFEKIEEAFTQINPHFKSIDFDYLGSKFQLVIREKNLSKTITAEHISDGTLRFLLLLSILYNPERGNLVCLDEPETGLHPDMIRTIAKAIKYAAGQGTQIILATHSPQLLNHFEVDDILIFEKNEHNETVVSTKDEDDFEDWNDNYSTGRLWLDGKLGGVRW